MPLPGFSRFPFIYDADMFQAVTPWQWGVKIFFNAGTRSTCTGRVVRDAA